MCRLPLLLFLLLLAAWPASQARAARSYDNCAGTITSLPAVITTQGVWCLKADLSTGITSGEAIRVDTNNVTIDCNDYKLGGLAAGSASTAVGIRSLNRQNITIRHCNLRGFYHGIDLQGATSGGHLVEDNRMDGNLHAGIVIGGERNRVQRNRVFDTGGATAAGAVTQYYGISANADVVDNIVSGVDAHTTVFAQAVGIRSQGIGSEVRGNVIRGLLPASGAEAGGIDVDGARQVVDGNRIAATALVTGRGVAGNGASDTFCLDNTVANFSIPMGNCDDVVGNANH